MFNKTKFIILAFLSFLFLGLLTIFACKKNPVDPVKNQDPVITGITVSPPNVGPGQTATIIVTAFDPDGDPLTIKYSSTNGQITPQTAMGDTATFTAGSNVGSAIIDILVCDDTDGETPVQTRIEIVLQAPCIKVTAEIKSSNEKVEFFYTPGEDIRVSSARITDPNNIDIVEFVPADTNAIKEADTIYDLQRGTSYLFRLGSWTVRFAGERPDGTEFTFVAIIEFVENDDGTIETIVQDCDPVDPPGVPDIEVDPDTLDYNSIQVNTTESRTFVVSNLGTGDLEVTDTNLTGADSDQFDIASGGGSFIVASKARHEIRVTFSPSSENAKNAVLKLHNNVTASPVEVFLTGIGVTAPGPEIAVDKDTLNYNGVQVNTTESRTFVVRNLGTGDLEVTDTNLTGADSDQFDIASGGGSFTVAKDATHEIRVTFSPTSGDVKKALLKLHNNVTASPVEVFLIGTGLTAPGAEIAVDTTTLDYHDIHVGMNDILTVVVRNDGAGDLDVTHTNLVGVNANLFTIVIGDAPFTLAENEKKDIKVSFNPTSIGDKIATLSIHSNDTDKGTLPIKLLGSGINPEIDVDPVFNFPGVQVNKDSSLSFEIRNLGTTQLTVKASIDGADFVIVGNDSIDVEPGSTQEIQVKFTPSTIGSRPADLNIRSNDLDESVITVDLLGNGINPEIDVDPQLDFGKKQIDIEHTMPFEIRNPGETPLTVKAFVTGGGDDFSIAGDTINVEVAPDGEEEITILFRTSTIGSKDAVLVIESNDDSEPSVSVALLAEGVNPQMRVNLDPFVLEYEDVFLDVTKPLSFEIENFGTTNLNVEVREANFGGDDADNFAFPATGSGEGFFSLAPGQKHVVTVEFTPTSPGEKNAELAILSDNDPNTPEIIVPLRGVGNESGN